MKEWAFSICLAVVAGCIVRMISPNSGMGKIINFVMSIFLLSCLFSGVILRDFDLDSDIDIIDQVDDITEKLEEIKEKKTLGEMENKIKEMVRKDLLLKKVNVTKILININTNDKSNILINSMEIFIKEGEEYDEEEIKSYIYLKYNVIPNIIF